MRLVPAWLCDLRTQAGATRRRPIVASTGTLAMGYLAWSNPTDHVQVVERLGHVGEVDPCVPWPGGLNDLKDVRRWMYTMRACGVELDPMVVSPLLSPAQEGARTVMLDQALNAVGMEQFNAERLAVEVHYSIPRGRAGSKDLLGRDRMGQAAGDCAWRIMRDVKPIAGVRPKDGCRVYAAACWDELEVLAPSNVRDAWVGDVMMRVRTMEHCIEAPVTLPVAAEVG